MNQSPPIRCIVPKDFCEPPVHKAASAWSVFEKNLTETWIDLRKGRCAPPFINFMPAGAHIVRPTQLGGNGSGKLVYWRTLSDHALIADRNLQAMRAKAAAGESEPPYFDFEHRGSQGGIAGEPLEFFWDGLLGIRARVRWSEEGERAILEGRYTKFSPVFGVAGDSFVGLVQNCGALISASGQPAFEKMRPIETVTKFEAMEACSKHFLNLVGRRADEIKNVGETDMPALKAFDLVKQQCPELFSAYELGNTLRREFALDA